MTNTVVQKNPSKSTKPAKEDGGPRGRGWHLKKHYVAPNGKVYNFGKLVSEVTVVAE